MTFQRTGSQVTTTSRRTAGADRAAETGRETEGPWCPSVRLPTSTPTAASAKKVKATGLDALFDATLKGGYEKKRAR